MKKKIDPTKPKLLRRVKVGTPVLIKKREDFSKYKAFSPVYCNFPLISISDYRVVKELEYLSLDDILVALSEIAEKYKDTYSNLGFEYDKKFHCYCSVECSCQGVYFIVGDRLETELELEFRLNEEANRLDLIQERELKELKRLQSKYRKIA